MLVCGVWLRGSDFVVLVDLVEILGVLEVVFWLHVEWCCCVYGREDLWGGEARVGVWFCGGGVCGVHVVRVWCVVLWRWCVVFTWVECGVWFRGSDFVWCWWIGECGWSWCMVSWRLVLVDWRECAW